MPAPSLSRGQAANLPKELVSFLNSITKYLEDLKGGANQNVPSFDFAITSADASDPATAEALANELKTDVNLLIIYVNLFATVVNNLQANLRAAGLLSEE